MYKTQLSGSNYSIWRHRLAESFLMINKTYFSVSIMSHKSTETVMRQLITLILLVTLLYSNSPSPLSAMKLSHTISHGTVIHDLTASRRKNIPYCNFKPTVLADNRTRREVWKVIVVCY